MSIRITLAALAIVAVAAPALAGSCPTKVNDINAKLESHGLSEDDASLVASLRDRGQALHDAGKHAQSVTVLDAALVIIEEPAAQMQ